MEHIRNWSCDGDSCVRPLGEVRLYPLGSPISVSFCIRSQGEVRDCPVGSTTELVLCRACWERANRLGRKSGLPPVNWHEGEVYIWTPETSLGTATTTLCRRRPGTPCAMVGLRDRAIAASVTSSASWQPDRHIAFSAFSWRGILAAMVDLALAAFRPACRR
jgi:hypothetical protein